MADEAERTGAEPNDGDGKIRTIISANGLGFCAWLCVCIELANREAQREGYRDQYDRAATRAFARFPY